MVDMKFKFLKHIRITLDKASQIVAALSQFMSEKRFDECLSFDNIVRYWNLGANQKWKITTRAWSQSKVCDHCKLPVLTQSQSWHVLHQWPIGNGYEKDDRYRQEESCRQVKSEVNIHSLVEGQTEWGAALHWISCTCGDVKFYLTQLLPTWHNLPL